MAKEDKQKKIDERYMRRCIQLARNGMGETQPNPMVGAVVVHGGRIIGEGYHRQCGGPHAEVHAIASVRRPELLPESTLYVSLEPCAHHGKTPPCADLILSRGIPRVVVGCRDPFARVDGLGIRRLREGGVEVEVGVLEAECLALNEHFVTRHTLRRPHITLKWAQSQDGYIDRLREPGSEVGPVCFSSPTTQALAHQLRSRSGAILVGARTALMDNPSLTVRAWAGRNPLRLVLDPRGTLPAGLQVFDGAVPTRVYVRRGVRPAYADKVHLVEVDESLLLPQLLTDLDAANVQSLLVEGGRQTLDLFLRAGLWDALRVEVAPGCLGHGVPAPEVPWQAVSDREERIDGRSLRWYRQPSPHAS